MGGRPGDDDGGTPATATAATGFCNSIVYSDGPPSPMNLSQNPSPMGWQPTFSIPSGHRVEPGMEIFYSHHAVARMEMISGKDCLEFRPERWISKQGVLTAFQHTDKFMVFNVGPKSCLGKDISFTQMKAVKAALVYNFQLQVLQDQVVSPKIAVVLHMKNGLMVKVRVRAAAASPMGYLSSMDLLCCEIKRSQ